MFYKVTLGFTTGATYNMTNVHVFKAAQARRAYFFVFRSSAEKADSEQAAIRTAEKLLRVRCTSRHESISEFLRNI